MKTAQDFRIGNVMMLDAKSPMVVLKNEFCTSGRNAAISKLKLRNILTGQNLETAVKAMDKYEEEILERKEVQYLYSNNDNWISSVFMVGSLIIFLYMLFKDSGIEEHEG